MSSKKRNPESLVRISYEFPQYSFQRTQRTRAHKLQDNIILMPCPKRALQQECFSLGLWTRDA